MRLVTPQPDDLRRRWDALVRGEEEALEHVGEVAEVEDVVELHRGGHEHLEEEVYILDKQTFCAPAV